MGWYRKNPIDVEAEEFTGDNWLEISIFTKGLFRKANKDKSVVAEVYDRLHDTWIGVHRGDYIIRGSMGEFYPHEGELFKINYSEVSHDQELCAE